MGITLFERWSPEYALNNTFDDMRKSGREGLKKHLTSNALKNLASFENLSENPEVSMFTSVFMGGNAVSVFLDKLSECEWTIKDVMKGSETSKAIVGFNYEDKMVGSMLAPSFQGLNPCKPRGTPTAMLEPLFLSIH